MKYIMGNWKMNKLPNEAIDFAKKLEDNLKLLEPHKNFDEIEVVLAVPYIDIFYTNSYLSETNVKVAAQDISKHDSGAYTSEVSAKMIASLELEYTLIGHSERRQYHNETDEDVNEKIVKALENNIKPVVCIGESLDTYEAGDTKEFLTKQLEVALKNLGDKTTDIIIAYEPVWAIGTGKVCDPDVANDVIGHIISECERILGEKLPVLYGGSANEKNSEELLSQENISGLLIGGASLDADKFAKIIMSA